MLNKLKRTMFPSEVERALNKANIDESHDLITNRQLKSITQFMKAPKHKNQLLNLLYRKMHADSPTLRIKALVVVHNCLREGLDREFIEVIQNEDIKESQSQAQLKCYLENNAINPYLIYLKRMCANKESYEYINQFSTQTLCQNFVQVETISHCFKILNMMGFILQFQELFNKMGRYHLKHNEMMNMLLQLLQDLDYFSQFIKRNVRILLKQAKEKKEKKYKCPEPSPREIEETRHNFLFLNEAQKISDRLYEFYHNRYYYKTLKLMISFPTFLRIDSQDYNSIKSQTRAVDRELVRKVKRSKYDRSRSRSSLTEPDLNNTVSYSQPQRSETQFDSSYREPCSMISMEFKNKRPQTEWTITHYEDQDQFN